MHVRGDLDVVEADDRQVVGHNDPRAAATPARPSPSGRCRRRSRSAARRVSSSRVAAAPSSSLKSASTQTPRAGPPSRRAAPPLRRSGVQHSLRAGDVGDPAVAQADQVVDRDACLARRRPRRAGRGTSPQRRADHHRGQAELLQHPAAGRRRRSTRKTPSTRSSAATGGTPASALSSTTSSCSVTGRDSPDSRPAMKAGRTARRPGFGPAGRSPARRERPDAASARAGAGRQPAPGDLQDPLPGARRDPGPAVQRERHRALGHTGGGRRRRSSAGPRRTD